MKHVIFTTLFAFILCVSPFSSASANEGPASFADMVEGLMPTVVNISSTQKLEEPEDFPEMPHFPPGSPFEDFFEEFMDRRGEGLSATPPASLGSGFVIDAEKGYVVTNSHVVKDADEVRVILSDDTTIDAEVIGRDEKVDLAVLQVTTDKKLVAAKFGNSDELRVGDWVVAIGNPFGLGGTVTAGIVSAQQRDINSGPYDDYIQTDASINRGNSGGPMFNVNGEVIGINTAIFSPSGGSVGIGFAVPSNLAEPVLRQLIEFGRTRRGWMGVRIQSVTDEIAESLGLDEAHGALIASVTETGPAEEAGLKAGDIILEFSEKKIDDMRTLPRIVAETPIGVEVKVKYWRDGKERETMIKVGELEKAEETGLVASGAHDELKHNKEVELSKTGLSLVGVTPQDREDYRIPKDVNGVLVVKVEPQSEANVTTFPQGEDTKDVGGVSGARLKAFIERVERLEEEKAALAEDIKEVYGEAKATGFCAKTIRKIVKLRKMDVEKRREEDMILDTYKAAVGLS
jgi:serine protease Do